MFRATRRGQWQMMRVAKGPTLMPSGGSGVARWMSAPATTAVTTYGVRPPLTLTALVQGQRRPAGTLTAGAAAGSNRAAADHAVDDTEAAAVRRYLETYFSAAVADEWTQRLAAMAGPPPNVVDELYRFMTRITVGVVAKCPDNPKANAHYMDFVDRCWKYHRGDMDAAQVLEWLRDPEPLDEDGFVAAMCDVIAQHVRTGATPERWCAASPKVVDRSAARQVFEEYVATHVMHLQSTPGQLAYDQTRVSIACNVGMAGSGKTTQLKQLCDDFVGTNGADKIRCVHYVGRPRCAVYVDLGVDGEPPMPPAAAASLKDHRVERRILHGLARSWNRTLGLADFITAMQKVEKRCDKSIRKYIIDSAVPRIIRRCHGLPDSAPVLIAVDGVRKLDANVPSPLGATSTTAVYGMAAMAYISQVAAVKASRLALVKTAEGEAYGPVFVAAAADAIDVAEFMARTRREVYLMPLPPVAPCIRHVLSTAPRNPTEVALQSAAFAGRANALLRATTLDRVGEAKREMDATPTESTHRAGEGRWPDTVAHPSALQVLDTANAGLQQLVAAATSLVEAPSMQPCMYPELLRSLFHSTCFCSMSRLGLPAALLCDAAGVGVAVLRRCKFSVSVFMPTQCIATVLCSEKSTIPAHHRVELKALCDDLQTLPRTRLRPEAPDGGLPLAARIVSRALVLRVMTLSDSMSLHELLFGDPRYDDWSFLARTKVLMPRLPKESTSTSVRAAAKCAAKADSLTGGLETGSGASRPSWRFANAPQVARDRGSGAPRTYAPFDATFEHPFGSAVDSCVLLKVLIEVGNDNKMERPLLLVLRFPTDEHGRAAPSPVRRRQGDAPEISDAMQAWLRSNGIEHVVTAYIGANAAPPSRVARPPGARLAGDDSRGRKVKQHRKLHQHRCDVSYDDMLRWCPSVAYALHDANLIELRAYEEGKRSWWRCA